MKTDALFNYSNFFSNTGILQDTFDSCLYPWEVLKKLEEFIDRFDDIAESAGYTRMRDGVYIGRGVTIDDTARIQDKAIIGHGATIGHAAYLRGGVILGEGVHVGHATEVKHSVILEKSALAHLNYIGDSIVGAGANISGGATLANWRFDKKEILIKHGDERLPTGLDKLGSIIGDNSFIGVNAVLNPGTVLAKDSLVFPLMSVKGTHLTAEVFK